MEYDRGVFAPRSIELEGRLRAPAAVDTVFELFSPMGEKRWVPGWDPELLHPPGRSWERGLVFRTREERGDAVWIVTALDRERHEVEYHRVEAGRYVARVAVRCRPEDGETAVAVAYAFVGLSETGNRDIDAMSEAGFDEKMRRWQRWIAGHLTGRGAE
jgi:hypothetical protein